MCGIALLYDERITVDEHQARMRAALKAMQHRGPDDDGLWQGPSISIGHRRLSIIDQSGSIQPMISPDGRYVLSFNGEIYNYQELRPDLEAHWQFQTHGDTEVLLAGLVTVGTSFIDRMEGMWAFALWDNVAQRLLLCRDRMGKKPLYYQEEGGFLACASELPTLKRLAGWPWAEDMDSSADFFRHGYYLPGTTAYQGVRELLPGHLLDWSPRKTCAEQPYWSLQIRTFQGSKEDAAAELRMKLIRAVKRRMVADVEVGAFLSGGVDSSLVVSIMCAELGVLPKTFTIGFQERSYDEREFAGQIATQRGTDHHVRVLESWDRAQLTSLILNNVGQPFADSSLLPTFMVSQLAASKVKVALSGDGGDELFSGYQRYQARTILRWYLRLPKALRSGVEKIIRAMPEPMAHHSRSLIKKAHLFQDIINRIEEETPYFAPVLYPQAQRNRLFPILSERGHQPPLIPAEANADDIQRMMAADALIYLPQDILVKVDRASMGCSLETRAPFLDRDVVELAFSLPRSWHRSGLSGKKMLRRAFADLLPANIWNRRKQGFGVPIHDWFRQDLGREFEELLAKDSGPINAAEALSLLRQHRQGQRDHGYRLWSLYIYLLWKNSEHV
ncbi:MAG: asparagine synthase (glutamine-hydrolysing) [Candidatus Electronema aureum]|uniref:asparagine synthase (glutamine-hydrolyzing) n=1 Tax=Candidatus Electronema aureum TaxID=2005002 RepID=A0A521G1B1_9BACT|nr:MAG: asparagine synthase (glutamine-hydrolysing) [Candidatus Electronema aureum]